MISSSFYKRIIKIFVVFVLLMDTSTAQTITRKVTRLTDNNIFNPQEGELRWAINQINANPAGGTIKFEIPASASASPPPYVIQLNGSLHTIDKPLTMDGATQPAYTYTGSEPKIVISGINLGFLFDGALNLNAGGSTIKNLCIQSFIGDGIVIKTSNCLISNNVINSFRSDGVGNFRALINIVGGEANVIQGNILGTNRGLSTSFAGSVADVGIMITNGKDNYIGGVDSKANIITNLAENGGGTYQGVRVLNSYDNTISRNLLYFVPSKLGIYLSNSNSNFYYAKPVITNYSAGIVSGTATHASDKIEIFAADNMYQSNVYLKTVIASSTYPYSWSANINYPTLAYLTATATELVEEHANTSEFNNYALPEPPSACSVVSPNQAPSIILTQPLNFGVLNSVTGVLNYTLVTVPSLNPPTTASQYILRLEVAPEIIDPITGALVPDWAHSLSVNTTTSSLATGARTQVITSLVTAGATAKNYFWRVGIQYQLVVGGHQPVLWSSVNKFRIDPIGITVAAASYLTDGTQHTNKINWVYGVSYLDNGLISEGIAYIDGLGKSRQVQSLMNSTNTVMAVEAAYSEEGGGVAMSLPAPISDPAMPGKFGYSYNFFDVFDGVNYSDFSTKNFDREIKGATNSPNTLMPPTPVDTTHGVGKYYSTSNAENVDLALGYPYAYNVPYKSPLQRPMLSAAGVGVDFKMTSGKEFKHFYGSPSQEELDRVFGVAKAPKKEKISRSITFNPDGVGSVSYTDNEGKLIATALTVCNPPASLKPLDEDGMNDFTVHVNPVNTDVMDPSSLTKTSSSKFFVPCNETEVTVKYDIDISNFQLNSQTPCMDCKYDVIIKLVNETTGEVVEQLTDFNQASNYTKAIIPSSTTCPGGTAQHVSVINQIITLSGPATYSINRIIKPYTDPTTHENVLTAAVNSYQTYLQNNQTQLLADFTTQFNTKTEYFVLRKQKIIAPSTTITPCPLNVTTFSGSTSGYANAQVPSATFSSPTGITRGGGDKRNYNFYIADKGNHTIRKIAENIVTVLSGAALSSGFVDGSNTTSRFNQPYDVEYRATRNIGGADQYASSVIVADKGNNAIRMVNTTTGQTTTLVGSANGISAPEGLGIDEFGVIYIASTGNNKIYSLDLSSGSPVLTQIASSYSFNQPTDIAVGWNSTLYITDRGTHSLITINSAGTVSTVATTFTTPVSVSVEPNSGNVFISDQGNNKISILDIATNAIQVLAGTGVAGATNGDITQAEFNGQVGLYAESSSTIYIADKGNHRLRKAEFKYCGGAATVGPDEWYADETKINDISEGSYTKELTQLDGDMDLNLQPGDEHYKLTSMSHLSNETIPTVGTAPTAGTKLANFILAYQRLNWINLTDKITSMEVFSIGSGSTLNSSTIATIDEYNALDASNPQAYYLLKVVYTKPSCAEVCAGVNNVVPCPQQCHEQFLALKGDMDHALTQLTTSTHHYYYNSGGISNTSHTLQTLVVFNSFPLNSYWLNQLTPADQILYLDYENKRQAFELFHESDCLALCGGTSTPTVCELCGPVYESCVYEHMTDLNNGYQYLMSQWTSSNFPYVYSDLIHGSGATAYPDDALSSSLGLDLLNYIATNIENPSPPTTTYTNFVDRAHWDALATSGYCSNCQAAASTSPACSAASPRDLAGYPSMLIPLLNTLSADCATEYNNCLQANSGTLAQQTAYLCLQNRDQTLASLGPEPGSPHDATNVFWTTWNTNVAACNTDYTNCINNTNLPTTVTQMRSDMISQTLMILYPNPSQAGTVTTLLASLLTLTASYTLPQLEQFLINYEDQQQCIINCEQELTNAFNDYIHELQAQASNTVTQTFINGCYANMNEVLDISYSQKFFHYTLYNYDFANNLVSTIPPEGIDYIDLSVPAEYTPDPRASRVPAHRMLSTYKSTSLYTITASSPDEGSTRYLYDKAGRLRFSQTNEQKDRGTALGYKIFSYIKYDNDYRVIESGEYRDLTHQVIYWSAEDCPTGICSYLLNTFSAERQVNVSAWPNVPANTFEETYVIYDASTLTLNLPCSRYVQTYLQGRVAETYNRDATTNDISSITHYSYDAHGRVIYVIQEATAFGTGNNKYKTVDYVYQGLSSRVDKIIYQKCNPQEQFIHKYTYDNDYRITKVEVSRDGGVNWLATADYNYYLHGPLKRTSLGNKIQDEDFVYNINGWLKAINNPLTTVFADDENESTSGSNFAPDVFSEAINYYQGDYKRAGVGLDHLQLTVPTAGTALVGNSPDLFSGNISSTVTNTAFNLTSMSSTDNILAQGYQYDYLNRLTNVYAEIQPENFTAFKTANSSNTYQYLSNISYDANGNIETLFRNSKSRVVAGTTTSSMDDMTYQYAQTTTDYHGYTKKINNKLAHVNDAAVDEAGLDDIKNQGSYTAGSPSTHNYKYDSKGRIISDVQSGISTIEWTASDKVKKITKTNGTIISFTYNSQQQRLTKKVDPTGSNNDVTTMYSYDASGILMATYEYSYNSGASAYQYKLLDHQMYGMGRVGTYNINEILVNSQEVHPNDASKQFFELTDHLGSVRAVVSGVKTSGNATIVQLTDYHEFGQTMQGRNFVSQQYRFGYQGSEHDLEVDGGMYTTSFRALDVRLGRWFSPDPITHPSWSPYVSMNDNPINLTDIMGLTPTDPPTQQCENGNYEVQNSDGTWVEMTQLNTVDVVAQGGSLCLIGTSYGNLVIPPPMINQSVLSAQGDYAAGSYSFQYIQRDEYTETNGLGGYYYKVKYEGQDIGGIIVHAAEFNQHPMLLIRYLKGEINNTDIKICISLDELNGAGDDPRLHALVAAGNYRDGMSIESAAAGALLEGIAGAASVASTYKSTNTTLAEQTIEETKATETGPKPYSKGRPSYQKGQVDEVWENAKQKDGNVYDPNTGEKLTWDKSKARKGQWDMGHKPGFEYRKLVQDFRDGKISKEEFLKQYKEAKNYQPEAPSSNRSGKFENK